MGGIGGTGRFIPDGASVNSGVIRCDRIDDERATALADAGRHDARLKCGGVAVERPRKIQRRVAFQRQTLSLGRFARIQRRLTEIERRNFRRHLI